MAKLGKHQIDKLAFVGITAAQITGCKTTRSLAKRGLMKAHGEDGDSWYAVTPEGLEALASSIRDGTCEINFTLERLKASKSLPSTDTEK